MLPTDTPLLLKGSIELQAFVNKRGKALEGIFDLFLITEEGQRFFIKPKASAVAESELALLAGKKVETRGTIRQGLWDTDNHEQQSRIGLFWALESISCLV